MTEIGFGLIDRRTVLVVLFTMVLGHVLFGLQLPLDTTNAGQFFVDLVLLTGYLYIARSIYRSPVALIASLILIRLAIWEQIGRYSKDRLADLEPKKPGESFSRKLKRFGLLLILYIGTPLASIIVLLSLILSFGLWVKFFREIFSQISILRLLAILLGTLDRIGLVLISLIAMYQNTRPIVIVIGIIGLIFMTAVFSVRGDFSSLVQDAIESEKLDENMAAILKNAQFLKDEEEEDVAVVAP